MQTSWIKPLIYVLAGAIGGYFYYLNVAVKAGTSSPYSSVLIGMLIGYFIFSMIQKPKNHEGDDSDGGSQGGG